MANRSSKRWPYVALVVLQTVIFGSGNAITKMAYDSITPLWCLAIRFGLALLVFALFFGPRIVRQVRGVFGCLRPYAWRLRTSPATWRSI